MKISIKKARTAVLISGSGRAFFVLYPIYGTFSGTKPSRKARIIVSVRDA